MSKPTKKLVFLEPVELPHENTEETLQRLTAVLEKLGIEVVEDRPNFLPKENVSCGMQDLNCIPSEGKKDTKNDT